ncbi:metal-dependent hydrolase [Arenicella xantha]|uniref:Metal-dependent hydrolase n=1 Tax=Arenicella xantha TaxID=644221 RepID=A0A395JQ45_9GAMM|nr:metal-dependent hydrolase [Arenicella xantha]RBP53463.1 hypothetical protein DFR28_101849 [Arenicella xantha]
MNAHTNPAIAIPQSNSKLAIEPRRVKFEFDDLKERFFYNENSLISALWVAMSASFPIGETEFIHSVKLFSDQVTDPKLQQEVKEFSAQEAHHSLQHRKINKLFDDLGYSTAKIEKTLKEQMTERQQQWSPERRLARTVVAEHVTAIMAHFALTNVDSMGHFPESLRKLFQWHAIEEIEHKSVAFDVYQHCVGDRKRLNREFRYFSYFEFPLKMSLATRFLLRDMGYKATWQERKELWHYLFGPDGLIKSVKPLYMMFLKPNFHPWDHDDSALVEQWKSELQPYFLDH